MTELNKNSRIKMKPIKRITNPSNHKKHSFIPFLPIIAILFLSVATISIVTIINNKKVLYSNAYTEEIPSISFESDDWGSNGEGSWHVDKSAAWFGTNQAKVYFEIKTKGKRIGGYHKDVILVLDVSESMNGQKLDKVKEDTNKLVETLLSEEGNRVALVIFDTNAEVKSYFVDADGKNTIKNLISGLTARDNTNYNDGLKKMEDVLIHDNYEQKENTDLVTLFLTDGSPSVDTPNEVATKEILKEKYPYLTIKGVSYETGTITNELKRISDEQFYANMESLGNVLTEAVIPTEPYESFQVVDYIEDEYFYIADESAIVVYDELHNVVFDATVEIINEDNGKQKIIWTLGPDFKSGKRAFMSIDLRLKDNYINSKNQELYPTNRGEKVISKLPEEDEKEKESNLTPVLKNSYDVVYENNAPKGCNIADSTTEKHFAFENVNIKSEEPTCPGYLFKGWKIVTKNVQNVNSNTFQMPGKNVTIRAEWSQPSILKNMDGTVYTKPTLYDMVKSHATINGNVYRGSVTDKYNYANQYANIYYYTNSNDNNVLYAGYCWKIARTTSTGGVKLLYNGKPGPFVQNPDQICPYKEIYHRTNGIYGTSNSEPTNLESRYWYGSSFDYDESTATFTLKGTTFQGTYSSDSNKDKYIGQYTCMSTDSNASCEKLYLISAEGTKSYNAYITNLQYSTSIHDSGIASVPFNGNTKSLGSVGYMFNTMYMYVSGEGISGGEIYCE